MDWESLLIPLLFIGIPLLGRILQGRAPEPPPDVLPPPPAEPGEARSRLPAPAPSPQLPGGPAADAGWSEGWAAWPGLEADEEEEAGVEGLAAGHDLDADTIHTAEAVSLEPVAVREVAVRPLPAAPVALDAAVVDRRVEHERFHGKVVETPAPPPGEERLADHLRSRSAVRRAVLLAEVLGPPRSLREIDEQW